MKPFMTTKNPKLLDPIRKYWYLCFLYNFFLSIDSDNCDWK